MVSSLASWFLLLFFFELFFSGANPATTVAANKNVVNKMIDSAHAIIVLCLLDVRTRMVPYHSMVATMFLCLNKGEKSSLEHRLQQYNVF